MAPSKNALPVSDNSLAATTRRIKQLTAPYLEGRESIIRKTNRGMKVYACSPHNLLKAVLTMWGCMQLVSTCDMWTNHARCILDWPAQPLEAAADFEELRTDGYTAEKYEALLKEISDLRCKISSDNTIIIMYSKSCSSGRYLSKSVPQELLVAVRRMFGFPGHINILVEEPAGDCIMEYAELAYKETVKPDEHCFSKSDDYNIQTLTSPQRVEQLGQGIITCYKPDANDIYDSNTFVTRHQLVFSGMLLYDKIKDELMKDAKPVRGSGPWKVKDFIQAGRRPQDLAAVDKCYCIYSIDRNSRLQEVYATDNK